MLMTSRAGGHDQPLRALDCVLGVSFALTFAVLMRDQPVSQLRFGFTLLAWLVGVAVVFGWLMYAFPL